VNMDTAFESGMFTGSRWSIVTVAINIPDVPHRDNPRAKMYADIGWFELGHLLPGETCNLSGVHNAQFWKTEEDTLLCRLDSGELGVYTHNSDYNWEERRYDAERIATALMAGEEL